MGRGGKEKGRQKKNDMGPGGGPKRVGGFVVSGRYFGDI